MPSRLSVCMRLLLEAAREAVGEAAAIVGVTCVVAFERQNAGGELMEALRRVPEENPPVGRRK